MAIGPGKYDDLATHVREHALARAVIVLVIDGVKGSGFSVQTEGGVVLNLPGLLRTIAADLERDAAEMIEPGTYHDLLNPPH